MSTNVESFWWESVTGPATLIEDVVDALAERRSAILELPASIPFEQSMRLAIQGRLRARNATRRLEIIDVDGSFTPNEVLPDYLMEDDRLKWRPGRMVLPHFLQSCHALAGQIMWVRQLTPTSLRAWMEFCEQWDPPSCEEGLILLELSGIRSKAQQVIRYESHVSVHSVRLLCDLLADEMGAGRLTDERLTYTATVLARLCNADVELASKLARSFRPTRDNALTALRTVAGRDSAAYHSGETHLWEAQLECLFPIIEHDRIEIIESHEERIKEILRAGITNMMKERLTNPLEIEVATLDWLMSNKPSPALRLATDDPGEREHVSLLHDCRNSLAHRKLLTDEQVSLLIDRQGWRPASRRFI